MASFNLLQAGASSTTLLTHPVEAEPKRKRKEESKSKALSPKRRKLDREGDSKVAWLANSKLGKKKGVNTLSSSSVDVDEDDSALEENYLRKQTNVTKSVQPDLSMEQPKKHEEPLPTSEPDSDDEQALTHESTLKQPPSIPNSRAPSKYVKPDETKEEKERRTIFIGNLPVDAAKTKAGKKAIIKHIKDRVPGCKVESIRFRSVAFKTASEPLPTEDGEKQSKSNKKGEDVSGRQQRDAERVSKWQAEHSAEGDEMKVYLKPNEKRRVAFIKQDFHEEASTINAYMVFAHSDPNRSGNVPALLDPFIAAERAIETSDGSLFMDRTIRVDRVTSNGAPGSSTTSGDMKLTVFVGNLDFTAKEEDLRKFFAKLVEEEVESKQVGAEHIKHVRIVRDGATQLGKGFAYVEFKERSVVDEILALEPQKLKFAKRKLRVQRCKMLPGSAVSALPKSLAQPVADTRPKPTTKGAKPRDSTTGQQWHEKVPMPKGDPSLGDKLRTLSKEERKTAKSSDPNRVARRLAKKKARNALQREGVQLKGKERSKVRDAKSRPSGTKSKHGQLKTGKSKKVASRE